MKFSKITNALKSYDFRTLNFRLILYTIALSVIGVLAVNSATDDTSTVNKQIAALIAGVILMLFFALVKYDFIARYSWLIYFAAIALLILVLTPLGTTSGGAQRWLPIGSFQFQPSEFCKVMLIVFFAHMMSTNQSALNTWKFILFSAVLMVIPLILIFSEPDLSTTIVTAITICVIIFTSPLQGKFIRKILLILVPLLAIIVALIIILPADNNIISEYQYNRIVGFYDSDNEEAAEIMYQQENSVLAIAGGGLTGKGLNNNSITSVKNADYITAPETDFIFTIIGEEMGFIGSMAVILLLALIVIECFVTGVRARDQTGKGIAIGMGTLIGVQAFINLGVAMMFIPNTGLTLPFVSAGMSSLIVLFSGIGIVLNIGMRRKNYIGGLKF